MPAFTGVVEPSRVMRPDCAPALTDHWPLPFTRLTARDVPDAGVTGRGMLPYGAPAGSLSTRCARPGHERRRPARRRPHRVSLQEPRPRGGTWALRWLDQDGRGADRLSGDRGVLPHIRLARLGRRPTDRSRPPVLRGPRLGELHHPRVHEPSPGLRGTRGRLGAGHDRGARGLRLPADLADLPVRARRDGEGRDDRRRRRLPRLSQAPNPARPDPLPPTVATAAGTAVATRLPGSARARRLACRRRCAPEPADARRNGALVLLCDPRRPGEAGLRDR